MMNSAGPSTYRNDLAITLPQLEELVRASVPGDTGAVTINESNVDFDFDDLGVDSLSLVEIVDRIQESLGVEIADDEILGMRTPRGLLDLVNGRLSRSGR